MTTLARPDPDQQQFAHQVAAGSEHGQRPTPGLPVGGQFFYFSVEAVVRSVNGEF